MSEIEQEAHAAADARFPESPLAPENEQRAEDFYEGYIAGASRPASAATRETVTEEMVERAARVLHPAGLGPWGEAKEAWRERTLMLARAALEAALGAEKGDDRG